MYIESSAVPTEYNTEFYNFLENFRHLYSFCWHELWQPKLTLNVTVILTQI